MIFQPTDENFSIGGGLIAGSDDYQTLLNKTEFTDPCSDNIKLSNPAGLIAAGSQVAFLTSPDPSGGLYYIRVVAAPNTAVMVTTTLQVLIARDAAGVVFDTHRLGTVGEGLPAMDVQFLCRFPRGAAPATQILGVVNSQAIIVGTSLLILIISKRISR